MERVGTGVRQLDAALGGGVPLGTSLLLTGEEGAGATEFALAFLRHAVHETRVRGRILSALRSPARVAAEYDDLFGEPGGAKAIEVEPTTGERFRAAPADALAGLHRADVLALESAHALAHPQDDASLTRAWRALADAASERRIVLLLLHSPGTLPAAVERSLGEAADGILQFGWQPSGGARRRALTLVKLRGLAPGVDGAEVPLFEISLARGAGITVDRGRSVL